MARIPPGEIQAMLDYVQKVAPCIKHETQSVRPEDAARALLHALKLANTIDDFSGGGLLIALQAEIDRKSATSHTREKEDAL